MIYPDCIDTENAENCKSYNETGLCTDPSEYVKTNCRKTCELCGSGNVD